MRRWMGLGAMLLGTAAQSGPRVAMVAAGRCQDVDLIRLAGAMESALQSKLGDALAGAPQFAERFAEPYGRSGDELREQIEASRSDYYRADYSSAERELRQALDEIDLLAGPLQWNLRVEAELLRAMVFGAAGRPVDAEGSFRRVLQLAPGHTLDPDLYPPLTRARFERVRRQVAAEPKLPLTVRSDPPAADVFLDGLQMAGKTPLTIELVPGRYTLRLANGAAASMPRRLHLTRAAQLDVDLDFEGFFRSSPFPCIAEKEASEGLARAAKFGRWLGVSEVIVARLGKTADGERALLGATVEVATAEKLREASVQVGVESERQRSAELAEYLLAGTRGDAIRPAQPSVEMARSSPSAMDRSAAPRSDAIAGPTAQVDAPLRAVRRGWRTPLGGALAGLGLIGLGAGTLFQVRSAKAWSEVAGYYSNGRVLSADDAIRVRSIRRRAQDQRNAATIAFATGAFALASGAMFLLVDGKTNSQTALASLAIAPLPGAIVISGSIR